MRKPCRCALRWLLLPGSATRDRKRPHENPSIGVLFCRTKEDEVVEYAISRHLSSSLVAQYETQMIPKAVLQQKLREWSLMLEAPNGPEGEQI